jgi:hypothetical protein
MFSRHLSAAVVGIAMVVSPIGGSFAMAQAPAAAAPTAASLQTTILTSARGAAAQSGFLTLANTAKTDALVAAISAGLAGTGAAPEAMADALIQAVASGSISGGVAIAVANSVAPDFAAKVSKSKVVLASIEAGGGAGTAATGATDTGGVSVLSNLGGPGGAGAPTATFDPCAGVTASYCGG